MSVTSWIAWRYLLSRRVGHFGPLLTIVAIASISIGIFSLVVVMSVMRGFKNELTDRMLGFNAHVTLNRISDAAEPLSIDEVKNLMGDNEVRDITPFVQGEVIAQSNTTGEPIAQGSRVRGIDLKNLGFMSDVEFFIPDDDGEGFGDGAVNGAIIGEDIVSQLILHPSFKDSVELIAPLAEIGPAGDFIPGRIKLPVTGIFRSGIYDYDSKFILIPLETARSFLGEQASEGWQIRLDDPSSAADILDDIKAGLPEGWVASGWHEENKKLFAALKLERMAMGSILVMAILIASFSISGVILLITSAKRKDVAILKSIGMKPRSVLRIFAFSSAYIGALGAAVGLVLGISVCSVISKWPIRLPDTYYLEYLPVDLDPLIASSFGLLGVLIALLSAIYPIRQIEKMSLIEVLRYE